MTTLNSFLRATRDAMLNATETTQGTLWTATWQTGESLVAVESGDAITVVSATGSPKFLKNLGFSV